MASVLGVLLATLAFAVPVSEAAQAQSVAPTNAAEPGCEALAITGQEANPRGQIYTVRNVSGVPMSFHINQAGIASSTFHLPAGATQKFGVEASFSLGMLGRLVNRNNPDVEKAELFDCYRNRALW